MKKHIPNIITLGNLFCGLLSIIFIFKGQLNLAIAMVATGAILDFFDGFVARILNVSGELGKQLDSLADMVTFGVVPGFLLLFLMNQLFIHDQNVDSITDGVLIFSALLVPLFSALRLAKFNIDENQKTGFIGLPTPANTLLIASFVWLVINDKTPAFASTLVFIVSLSIICAYLLISPIPMFALKFKAFKWKENEWRYSFILITIILIASLQMTAIPIVVILYVLMSFVKNAIEKKGKGIGAS